MGNYCGGSGSTGLTSTSCQNYLSSIGYGNEVCNGPAVCAFVATASTLGYPCTGDVYGCAGGPPGGLCGDTTISETCGVSSGDVYPYCDGGQCLASSSSGECDVYRCGPTSARELNDGQHNSPVVSPTARPTEEYEVS